jgi:hypothetical protein
LTACVLLTLATQAGLVGAGLPGAGLPGAGSARDFASAVPRLRHIVIVVMENRSYSEIIGNRRAPFINALARRGALFTASYAVTHPSEPNYLALFSGSTHGVTSDRCPITLRGRNLAAELLAAGLSFTGYAEDLPAPGSLACARGEYARKHVPWTDFTDVPRLVSQPFDRFPARHLRTLPTVSFVIPNLCHDMHNCSVAAGDRWVRIHLAGYARWAMTHSSLLILTWDEDDGSVPNHITTIFVGQQVRPGRYRQPITHYNVLRTIEQALGLPRLGRSATAAPILGIWRRTR